MLLSTHASWLTSDGECRGHLRRRSSDWRRLDEFERLNTGGGVAKTADYIARIIWTGDRGQGTKQYRGYDRTWRIATDGKLPIECSNDPALGGDPSKPNPEDLLLSSLASCHMLWFLHLASNAGIVVRGYEDMPLGVGEIGMRGEGRFVRAILRPVITAERGADLAKADALHHAAHDYCFISRSVNFPIAYEATYFEV